MSEKTPELAALPKVHAHPDDLFDEWWDETYEADEGPQAPDRHVPRDAFHAGWDHARALLAPNGGVPKPAPELAAAMAESRQLRELVTEILGEFRDSGDGRRARVGQVQIAKWRQRAGIEG